MAGTLHDHLGSMKLTYKKYCRRTHSGMSVIQRMGMVPTDKDDKPRNPITIHKARAYKGVPPDDDEDDEFADANRNVLAITAGS